MLEAGIIRSYLAGVRQGGSSPAGSAANVGVALRRETCGRVPRLMAAG